MRPATGLRALVLGMGLVWPAAAGAQEIGTRRTFGLGVVAGYPGFGVSMNVFLNPRLSLQIDPTFYARRGETWVGGRVDVLFYPGNPLARESAFDLRWYVGPGLGFGWNLDKGYLALVPEVPIGVGFQFRRVPIDLMIEAVPQFWLGIGSNRGGDDGLYVWVSAALHARYYF